MKANITLLTTMMPAPLARRELNTPGELGEDWLGAAPGEGSLITDRLLRNRDRVLGTRGEIRGTRRAVGGAANRKRTTSCKLHDLVCPASGGSNWRNRNKTSFPHHGP